MRSKIVEEQLKKCAFADLTNFDAETNTYTIRKYQKPQYEVGAGYIIQLPKDIIGNTTSVLATNWNAGRAPENEYYKAYVSKIVGKMIYVDCLAFDFERRVDLPNMWSGYLPSEEISQISKIYV